MKDVTPQDYPLVYNLHALRKPGGEKLGIDEVHSMIRAIAEPGNYWRRVKDFIIAPDGSSFETCLRAVARELGPDELPTSAQLEEAVAYASR